MSPDQVIDRLASLGVKWSRSTLLRAVKDGLGPEPKTGAGGRGYGRWTDYPDDAFAEFYASHILIKEHKMMPEKVAMARMTVILFRINSQTECLKSSIDPGFKISRLFGKQEKQQERRLPKNPEVYHEYANILHSTEGALQWWEFKQAAFSYVDSEYAELLEIEIAIGGLAQIILDSTKWFTIMMRILTGAIYLIKMEYQKKWRVLAWTRLISNNPRLQTQTKAGVVSEFGDIPEATIQFLATRKMPEPVVTGVMDPLTFKAELDVVLENFKEVGESESLDAANWWVSQFRE